MSSARSSASTGESFPRQSARTQRFTAGSPRAFTITADGGRVLFLRSRHGSDRVGCLWSLDLDSGTERLLVDPAVLGERDEELSVAERARRERAREASAGIVGYAIDGAAAVAAFALSSRLWATDLDKGATRELPAIGPVLDPRPDPTGTWVAYGGAGALRLTNLETAEQRVLAEPDGPSPGEVTWGLAEFVAAEEMDRYRGYWWAPDGTALMAARVDESPVQRWHIADPANPERPPVDVAYPAAGTANADVTLWLLGVEGGRTQVQWDGDRYPYVVTVSWTSSGPPLLHVMSRDQRSAAVVEVEPASGRTTVLAEDSDPVWLDVVPGVPAWLPDGRLVRTADRDGARRLLFGDDPVTPSSLQVASVAAVDETGVLVVGTDEATQSHLWLVDPAGAVRRLTGPGGHHGGSSRAATLVVSSSDLHQPATGVEVRRDGLVTPIDSFAETPCITAEPTLFTVGERALRVGVLLPRDHVRGTPLPVLMDPYGGPHHQEVLEVNRIWLEPQWLADQGFAVVVADGRGTGARGPDWDRAVHHDFAGVTLQDQVDALTAIAAEVPDLDLNRVAIRGWSYGGYLAALAVLRRPDIFSAAVAGAPVTDWRLYDTFYTERYLGHPDDQPEVFERNSLLGDAAKLTRPLLLIHGLADDNVVAAHTLRLSSALLAAGRPHDVLPLSWVTHMTPHEVVAENLLLLQVEWLHRALTRPPTPRN
jgi:dipeptidyl-peptidase-4